MEWRFNQLTKNETIRNPSHLEFFHDEALQSVVDAFVREDIQNRLDAKAKNQIAVKVEYSLCGPEISTGFRRWFTKLGCHLAADGIKDELGYSPKIEGEVTWLLAEDFRTTGLNGDPLCYQDPHADQKPRNDFYWFIRNVGRSGKSGADRGRWGLGKIVYPAASKIRSFFAYSVQEGSLRNMLIGRSVLAIHHLDGRQHDSEGYFGEYLDEEAEFFATPSEDLDSIAQFRDDFKVRRSPVDPGLTIAIPFPDEDITFGGLIESIVKHWFMVLIEGRLEVVVRLADEEVQIDGGTLEEVITGYVENQNKRKQLLRQVNFARLVHDFDQKGERFFSLKRATLGRAPTWNQLEERFESLEKLEEARKAYCDGKPVGFEIPVQVARIDGSMNETPFFEVYIQRTDDPAPPSEMFLRDGMAILGLGRVRESGLLAVIRAENNELGMLLGDAENPAHTRWERSGKHFRNKYKHGPSILSLVKQSAERLSTFLTTSEDGQDRELLRGLFFLPEEGEGQTKKKAKPGGKKNDPDDPKPKARKPYITLKKRNDGFIVTPHAEAERAPDRFIIRAAYNVDRGNPFKAHHSADFDFTRKRGGLLVEMNGVEVEDQAPNRLVCRVTDPDFKFSAEGFDRNRDLVVNVRPETDREGDEAEKTENETAI